MLFGEIIVVKVWDEVLDVVEVLFKYFCCCFLIVVIFFWILELFLIILLLFEIRDNVWV